MSTIQNLFQEAQLAEAAYANFFDNAGNLDPTDAGVKAALLVGGMSNTQATAFVNEWTVIDQYSPRRAHSLAVRRMKDVNQ